MKNKTLSSVAVLILCVACSDSEETLTSFPSSVGSEWNYQTVITMTYLDSNRVDTVAVQYSTMLSSRISQLGPYHDVIQLDVYWIEYSPQWGIHTGNTTVWYTLTEDALTEVAYYNSGSPLVYPKVIGKNARLSMLSDMSPWWTMIPVMSAGDTLYRRREALRFPLSEGTSWVSFTDPWTQTCKVNAIHDVTVPAGTFRSFRVEHRNHLESNDFVFHSCFTDIGLVKRTFHMDSLEVTTPEDPDGTGEYFNMDDVTELVDYVIYE